MMEHFKKNLEKIFSAAIFFGLFLVLHSCKDESQTGTPYFAPRVASVTQTEAHIDGVVACVTLVYVEYGLDTSYGDSVSGGTFRYKYESNVAHAYLKNLNPGTTYHFRGVAKNNNKTYFSSDHTFTTLP